MLALQSAEVDLVMDVPREQAATIRSRSGLKAANAPVGRTMLMYLNIHGHEPYVLLQDPAIRQAIGYALDRQTLVSKVWEGNGSVISTMGPTEVLGQYASTVQGRSATTPRRPPNCWITPAGWPARTGYARRTASD